MNLFYLAECIFLHLLIIGNSYEEDEGDLVLSELPPEIQDDLLSLTFDQKDCSARYDCIVKCPDTSKVKFLLYKKNDVNDPVMLERTNLYHIDQHRSVVFIIHGWRSNADGVRNLRNSYLVEDKSNVIVVEWANLAGVYYPRVCSYIPCIAKYVKEFIIDLNKDVGIPVQKMHLVGHSLGAHMSGFIGKFIMNETKSKIGRITGLDPAGPLYNGKPESKRLCPSDASFVEVIHSNAGIAGYSERCGTVDYYLNGGTFQPFDTTPWERVEPKTWIVGMSHSRSKDVWAEAVHTTNFKAKKCKMCPHLLGKCWIDDKQPSFFNMGALNPPHNSYYVPTNHKLPFAMGCAAFPGEPCN